MAVYRSDQAQLTFGTEAAPGGYPEIAVTGSMVGTVTTKSGVHHPAGSRSLQLSAHAGMTVGAFVCIGGGVSNVEQELRKIEHVLGTGTNTVIYLDAPTAFYHAALTVVQIATGTVTPDQDNDKFIKLVPGVYETVDVPDPDMTIEARYFLGTQSKRNFFAAYKGQQTYTGSVPGFILLDGRALRYPIGKVVTVPSALLTDNVALLNGAARKGDVYITYDGTNASTISASSPHNILCIDDDDATLAEVRKVISTTGSIAKLDYPLQFAHDDNSSIARVDTAGYYTHTITETVDLDTVSWHLHMRDSGETAANDFDRRYYGGKIGGATLSADEGGMLNMSWDGVNFQGMVHNQKLGSSGSGGTVPFYSYMQSIAGEDIVFPNTEPYYFSQGSVSIFGQEIARVRNFNLSIANNEEPRYYISRRYGRQRGPSEIREQRREYSFSCTLALPDSTPALTDTTARLFNELLWEGDYGAGSGTGMQGFNIVLRFDRGTNDSIVITIPSDGVAATGGNEQGAFIRTAPHAITGDNPLQVDADVLFRNLKIVVTDSLYYYP